MFSLSNVPFLSSKMLCCLSFWYITLGASKQDAAVPPLPSLPASYQTYSKSLFAVFTHPSLKATCSPRLTMATKHQT